jgi:uncharacterized RDD family membrane protein YckC
MSDKIYTLVIDGKPQGPFSLEELKEKPISSGSFIRKPGMDDYKEAHEFAELRELLGFHKEYTLPQYFAGFDLRLLASCLDWFIIVFIITSVTFVGVLFFDLQENIISILISNVFLLPLLKIIYHIILETKYQVTIGKKLLNIKVTTLEGLKPSFNMILIRNLSKIISTAIFFFGYLYSFLNKKQQCLHDVIAKTLVIKERLI